jgi:hypothetical protein
LFYQLHYILYTLVLQLNFNNRFLFQNYLLTGLYQEYLMSGFSRITTVYQHKWHIFYFFYIFIILKGLALVILTISAASLLLWEFVLLKLNYKSVSKCFEKIQTLLNKKIFSKRVKVHDLIKWSVKAIQLFEYFCKIFLLLKIGAVY